MSKKSPAFDPQRQEVYHMERHGLFGLNRSRLSKVDHARLMKDTCAQFDVEPPRLIYKKAEQWAGMYRFDGTPKIYMSTTYLGGLSAMTLLHEVAHYLVHRCDPEDVLEPHGAEFVGVYGDLMECTGFIPFGSWKLLTDRFKIQRIDTSRLRPHGLMKAVKKRAAEAAPKSPPRKRS